MPEPGLSSADFMRTAGVSTLKRNGQMPSMSPVQEAMAVRTQMLGQRIMEQTVAEKDSDALKAQNERLKLEIEQRQLQEAAKGAGGGEEWQKYVLEELRAAQAGRDEATKALQATQVEGMNQRLGMLQGELQRIQSERPEPVNPLAQVRQTAEQFDSLRELFAPKTEALEIPRSEDPAVAVMMRKLDVELQRASWEREDRHAERMEELRLSREAREAELRLQQERAHQMDRFFTDTSPKVLDVVMKLVTHFTQGQPGAGMPVAAAPPISPQAAPSTLPPGVQAMPCRQCGGIVMFRPEWPGAFCGQCGAEYGNSPPAAVADVPPRSEAAESSEVPRNFHVEGIA